MKTFLLVIIFILPIVLSNTCTCPQQQAFDAYAWSCNNYPKHGDKGYLKNCIKYEVQRGEFQCVKCDTSFNLVINQRTGEEKCVKTELEGCIGINGGPSQDQFLQNPLYQLKQVLQYGNSYQCYMCDKENYYYKDSRCYKNPSLNSQSHIKNCSQYEWSRNELICNECQEGYYQSGNYQSCIKNPYEKNCVKFEYNSWAGTAACSQCKEGYSVTQNYGCEKTESIIKNCGQVYYSSYYYCSVCKSGYYLSEDKKSCEQFPSEGQQNYVANCSKYQIYSGGSKPSCIRCQQEYYFNKNSTKCIKVNDQQFVDHCKGYHNGGECYGCEEGYYPTSWNYKGCKKCPN